MAQKFMSNESIRKAFAEIAEVLRAWGKFNGSNSPEAREAARGALELTTRYLYLLKAASNSYGCPAPVGLALEWASYAAAEWAHTDLGDRWAEWRQFTQPHLWGGFAPVGLPDELDRWTEALAKSGAVLWEATFSPLQREN